MNIMELLNQFQFCNQKFKTLEFKEIELKSKLEIKDETLIIILAVVCGIISLLLKYIAL